MFLAECQPKYVCWHCYLDGERAIDACIDGKHKYREGKKYLPVCKVCIHGGTQLVWSRGKKTNKLQSAHAKRAIRDQI